MLKVYADEYVNIGRIFEEYFRVEATDENKLVGDVLPILGLIRSHCDELKLPISSKIIQAASEALPKAFSVEALKNRSAEIYRVFCVELEQQVFYQIPAVDAELCEPSKPLLAPETAQAFPTCASEFTSSAKCLAFGLDTAAVLHLMRALEVGLGALASRFSLSFEAQNWQKIIDQIEAKIKDISKDPDKPADWREEERYYAGVARSFWYFKNTWRNHAMHVREQYSSGDARGIFFHVKDFINSLPPRLKEQKTT